jgi:predicted RNase H-like HicB family nuclease
MTREGTYHIRIWQDGHWYVGLVREVPGCVSQGVSFPDLLRNLADAYALITSDNSATPVIHETGDAGVAESAYAADSKPAPERGEGSTPSSSTSDEGQS